MSSTRTSARGFTLVEMLVALALSSVITTAALEAFVAVSRLTRRSEQEAYADQEAKLLSDYVMSTVQQTGGGNIRPWMGVAVDDNCSTSVTVNGQTMPACDSSDRLHVAVVSPTASQCTVTSVVGNTVTSPTGSCCLNNAEFLNQSVVVFTAGSGEWRADRCTAINTGTCTCTLTGNASAYGNFNGSTNFASGWITPGTTDSFFLDPTTQTLKLLSDSDNNGTPEITELADRVADFQVQLGFDTDGDQQVDRFQAGYSGVTNSQLREVRIGIIVAAPVPARETSSRAQLFNGPVRSATRGKYMRAVSTRSVFRNLNIFF
ncbi:MAG TPA: PilW family protein [Myxococcota bacterium]